MEKNMNFHILTLFPEMVMQGLNTSIIGRACEKGLLHINALNIRDFTIDKHKKVDDYPYGGGAGMLMQAQPVYDAYKSVADKLPDNCRKRVIYVTPQGYPFTQRMAENFAKDKGVSYLTIGCEAKESRNLAIYLHFGYTEFVTSMVENDELVLFYGKKL